MNWWNFLQFGVIPVLAVASIFFIRRKLLWIAPFLSTILAIVANAIRTPSILSYGEHRAMFFILVVPGHFVFGIILALLAYVVGLQIKQKKK